VVRERRLAPAGWQLFASREMDRLHHAVDTALASQ
jgi:hypothetical protein